MACHLVHSHILNVKMACTEVRSAYAIYDLFQFQQVLAFPCVINIFIIYINTNVMGLIYGSHEEWFDHITTRRQLWWLCNVSFNNMYRKSPLMLV